MDRCLIIWCYIGQNSNMHGFAIHAGKSNNLLHSSQHELATTTCAHSPCACNHVKPQALLPYILLPSFSHFIHQTKAISSSLYHFLCKLKLFGDGFLWLYTEFGGASSKFGGVSLCMANPLLHQCLWVGLQLHLQWKYGR